MDITKEKDLFKMNIRAFVFWCIDFLRGKRIRKSYNFIFQTIYNGGNNKKQLDEILDWAINNIPFYKKYKGYNSIKDFPIIDKNIIRKNEDDFLAPSFDKETLFKEETSGSTGTPFVVYQDKQKRLRAAADTIAFSQFAGYNFGTKLYYSRVWNNHNKKTSLQSKIQNIVMQDSNKLSNEELETFLKKLENDSSEKSVLIFASSLTALNQYMDNYNRKTSAKISCFITMSESLPKGVRKGIEEKFRTTVVSRYSNCECGIIAQQCPSEDEYHINTASFYVELLKLDSNEDAGYGEPGRIVVTDLYNKAMPLIRYDTGDVGIMSDKSSCGKGSPVFTRIDGRRIDCIYSTKGEMMSPYIINNTLWYYRELNQYQFVQNGENDYLLKLNIDNKSFLRENELLNDIKKYIGEDANIKIEYIDEIPLLASGKRKQVVNNYIKNK